MQPVEGFLQPLSHSVNHPKIKGDHATLPKEAGGAVESHTAAAGEPPHKRRCQAEECKKHITANTKPKEGLTWQKKAPSGLNREKDGRRGREDKDDDQDEYVGSSVSSCSELTPFKERN